MSTRRAWADNVERATLDNETFRTVLYAPPEHPPDTVHRTKADADAAEGD